MNKFRCALIFLTSFSLLLGIFVLAVSCLMVQKIGKDFLSEKGDICAAVNTDECSDKKKVNPFIENPLTDKDSEEECSDSCGFLTCPGFSEKAKTSKLCSIICTCKQGRSAAASLALCVGVIQTLFGAVYFLLVFIYNAWIKTRSFKARWLAFVISHAVFLALLIVSLILSMIFHLSDKPANYSEFVLNSDENFEGTIFLIASAVDLTLCLVAIIVILVFQKVIKNPDDENSLCGTKKKSGKGPGGTEDKKDEQTSLSSSQKKITADGSEQSIHPSQSSRKTNSSSLRKTRSQNIRSKTGVGKNQVRPQSSSTGC